MCETFTDAPSGAVHNTRKYHKRINKVDRVEPIGVEYMTTMPTNPKDVQIFPTKAQLFDFIEYMVRYKGFRWEDFTMVKITKQKLIS